MSFVSELNALPLQDLLRHSLEADQAAVLSVLSKRQVPLHDFATLISPAAAGFLEPMSQKARALTQQRFGKVIRLFAPLYVSNECINNCKYCGFSRDNPILRVTLSMDEVRQEAIALRSEGFRNILIVAGEHPRFVSNHYLADCIRTVRSEVPGVSLEVGPMEKEDYVPLVDAGADGLVVYQETYDRQVYEAMHTAGPKKNFDWRLETPERAYAAGFRRLGIAALYGLADWRAEALCVAAHASYLLRHCWKAQVTLSLPRLRPCAGEFQPLTHVSDRDLTQLVCAFRLMFPDAGIVLSTRETPRLRDGLMPLGITLMSAGSHTEPGGYTGAGRQNIHRTVQGRQVALEPDSPEWQAGSQSTSATVQFQISDGRSAGEIASRIRQQGYDPVWKDWDTALTS